MGRWFEIRSLFNPCQFTMPVILPATSLASRNADLMRYINSPRERQTL